MYTYIHVYTYIYIFQNVHMIASPLKAPTCPDKQFGSNIENIAHSSMEIRVRICMIYVRKYDMCANIYVCEYTLDLSANIHFNLSVNTGNTTKFVRMLRMEDIYYKALCTQVGLCT